MGAKLIKTSTGGIYKRGRRYVFRYRDATGRQRWESTRTLGQARELKRRREVAADDGQHDETTASLHDYTQEWINTYTGRTRRGFRDETRSEYRRQLEQYLLRFPGFEGKRLKDIGPKHLQGFVAWLEREQTPPLADATVQRIMAPVKAMFATAYELEDLRRNPATKIRLSNRDEAKVTEDDEQVKAMSREQLERFLAAVDDKWQPFFVFLAVTGVRISEAIALQWKHVQLTGSDPHVKIRQRIVKGALGAPKSRYGRRDIPLPQSLMLALIQARRVSEWPRETDYVFPSMAGTPVLPATCSRGCSSPRPTRPTFPGSAFTRSATPVRRC